MSQTSVVLGTHDVFSLDIADDDDDDDDDDERLY